MITYRLANSLPKKILFRIDAARKSRIGARGPSWKMARPGRVDFAKQAAEQRKQIEAWLDAGHGSCVLHWPDAASCVVDTRQRFAEERYDLIAWVMTPNRVHVLIQVYAGIRLGKIVQSWKSYTGKRIGQMLAESKESRAGARRSQRVWMQE